MGRVSTAVLCSLGTICWGCSTVPIEKGQWHWQTEDISMVLNVEQGLFSDDVCVDLVTSAVFTVGCVPANIDVESQGEVLLTIPVEAAVGRLEYTVRVQRGVVKIPHTGKTGFIEGALQKGTLSTFDGELWRSTNEQAILTRREAWVQGAFGLQNQQGEMKGAIVFDGEEARIFVFDRHWLTPEIEYVPIVEDGLDWILEFESEPQFFDEPTYVKIHLLDGVLSIPQGTMRTEQDIEYRLTPNPPSFEQLQVLQKKQISDSMIEEKTMLQQAVQNNAKYVGNAKDCLRWPSLPISQTPIWLGYTVSTSWNGTGCDFSIEPEVIQYRRTFTGVIQTNLDSPSTQAPGE